MRKNPSLVLISYARVYTQHTLKIYGRLTKDYPLFIISGLNYEIVIAYLNSQNLNTNLNEQVIIPKNLLINVADILKKNPNLPLTCRDVIQVIIGQTSETQIFFELLSVFYHDQI